jgi:hypothetical protein
VIEAIVEMGSEEAPLLLPAPAVEGCPGCAMELQASIHINYCLLSINALALHLPNILFSFSEKTKCISAKKLLVSDVFYSLF